MANGIEPCDARDGSGAAAVPSGPSRLLRTVIGAER